MPIAMPNADKTTRNGRARKVPVSVQRNPGSAPAKVATLGVQVSFDRGAHWQNTPVVHGTALIHNPAAGTVSLRANATDTTGNTVQQTIIDAYHVR